MFYKIKTDFKQKKLLKDKFLNYKTYDEEIFTKQYNPYQLDTWNENRHYGLLDQNSDFVIPSLTTMKPLKLDNTLNDLIMAQDFVINAFSDMRKYYTGNIIYDKQAKDFTNLYTLSPKSGFIKFETKYLEHLSRLFNYIENNIPNKKTIKNFNDFILRLLDLFEIILASNIPFSQVGYLQSQYSDNMFSGLTLSFEDVRVDHRQLDLKYSKYLNNKNFNLIVDAGKRYGFIIDKNCPWRITADLNSPNMQTYMGESGLASKEEYFSTRLIKSKYIDLGSLRAIIASLYNAYLVNNSLVLDSIKIERCKTEYSYATNIYSLPNMSTEMLADKYDDFYFVRLYCYIRFKESKLQINQNEFDKIVLDAQKIYKYVGYEACVNYISNFTKTTIKEKTFQLTSDEEVGKILATLKQEQVKPTFKF